MEAFEEELNVGLTVTETTSLSGQDVGELVSVVCRVKLKVKGFEVVFVRETVGLEMVDELTFESPVQL
jgi:hypothetical protein